MEMTADMIALGQDYFEHHGIQGQKWGVRRFQNEDGSLTPEGRKRYYKSIAGDKEATLLKGQSVYRISSNDKSDATEDKIYVSASKNSGDFYMTNSVGSKKIYSDGKAFVQEYVLNSDLKMPDKKTMEKIELELLNDEEVQKELVTSLMAKGLSREEATAQVRPYNSMKDVPNKVGNVLVTALAGTWFGVVGSAAATPVVGVPLGIAVGRHIYKTNADEIERNSDRRRVLTNTRLSYGDKNNKILNEKLKNELQKRGYNAMKDYNDRRAFGKKGEHAVIILDGDKNLTFKKSEKVSEKMYGEAYARQYLKDHPKSKLKFNDLVSDGEKRYRGLYNQGILDRRTQKEQDDYLSKNGGILPKDKKLTLKSYGESYAKQYLKDHPNSKLSYQELVSDGEKKYRDLYKNGSIVKHSLTSSWSNTRWNNYDVDELYHSGVKKQKWGLRRWQYEDGSLTPAGREHYRKLRLKAMTKGQSKKSDVEEKPKHKSIENMTDAELKKATNRLTLEDAYYQKQKSIAASKAEIKKNTPEPPKSLGKKFTEKLMNDVIVPAATNAGKDYLEKYLKKLGEQRLARRFS